MGAVWLVLGVLLVPLLQVLNVAGGLAVKRVLRRRLCRLARGRLVLTYDDGPGRELQQRLLESLDAEGARATFFLLGMRADAFATLVHELAARGHEVANHGLAHLDAARSDPITVAADLRQSWLALSRIGVAASCYRPAYGRLTLLSWLQARRHGPVVFWTHDSCDLSERPRPVSDLVADVQRDGGGIVLFHSHDRWRCDETHDYVVAATRALLRMARQQGLAVTTCAELFGVPELHARPVPTA